MNGDDQVTDPQAPAVVVTQEDRDAAAFMCRGGLEVDVSQGRCDGLDIVQAFARHPISHSLPGEVGMLSDIAALRAKNARLRAHIAASANNINIAGSAYDEAIAALDRLVAETKSSARAALSAAGGGNGE